MEYAEPMALPRTEDLVLETVRQYEYAAKSRIHNTLYLADLEKMEDSELRRSRVTGFDFKHYFRGVISGEVSSVLERLEESGHLETEEMPFTRCNDPSSEWLEVYVPTPAGRQHQTGLPEEDMEILEQLTDDLRTDSCCGLIERVKDTRPYILSSFNEPVDFDDFY